MLLAQSRQRYHGGTPVHAGKAEDEVQRPRLTVGIGDAEHGTLRSLRDPFQEYLGAELPAPRIVRAPRAEYRRFDIDPDAAWAHRCDDFLGYKIFDRLNR